MQCVKSCWLSTVQLFICSDAVAGFVRCFQYVLGSLGYNFQMRAPCPIFALLQVLA